MMAAINCALSDAQGASMVSIFSISPVRVVFEI